MVLTTIFTILTLLSALHVLQVNHLLVVTRNAGAFLYKAREAFIARTEYATEIISATVDAITLRDYYSSLSMYSMIALAIFPLNIIGAITVGIPNLTLLYLLIAIGDSLILLNMVKMWHRLLHINAVCKGYNVAVQSIQYIDIEPKENQ